MKYNKEFVLGIDIGKGGAMSLINKRKEIIFSVPMPMKDIVVNKKKKKNYDIPQILKQIKQYKNSIQFMICEKLYAMPGQYSQTAMSLGYGIGIFEAIQTTLGVSFVSIDPRTWQNTLFKGLPKDDTKKNSKKVASKLFPAQNLKKTPRCKKDDDGLSDSLLIQYYGLITHNF